MTKVINYVKNNLLESYIIINILYIAFISFLYALKIIPNLELLSKSYIVLLIINIVTILFNKKRYSFHKTDIVLLIFIIVLIISTIFAYNINVSLFGYKNRYEGLFTFLYYISLFYLSTYCKNKKIIIYSILFTGYIQLVYGMFQNNGSFGVPQRFFLSQKLITGFTTNPNFFGAYMLICLCLSIGLFIQQKDNINSIVILLLSCCFFSGLLFSNTLSCLLGLGISLIVLIIYCIKEKKLIKFLILIIALLSTFLMMHKMNQTALLKDLIDTKDEAVNINKGKIDDKYGNDRVYLWKKTISYIQKYIYHGIGIDNFSYINNGKPITKNYNKVTFIYDKAHNDYLQILITMGIIGLISVIMFHLIVLVDGFKNSFRNKEIYLLLPVLSYLVFLMFSISVIEVSPIFYICMGLLIKRENNNVDNNTQLKLEVLLSIMNLNKRQLKKMNISSNCVIINQCNKRNYEEYKNYRIYSYNEKGVSNSRNRGLEHIKEDIILLCDDDIKYVKNYEEIIINEFKSNPQADIILFNLESDNRKINSIRNNKRIHIYNGLGFASCNIAFRRERIIEKNIKFNTLFGPGGKYSHGEDTLFIVDSLKNKLKIYGVNKTIGSVNNTKSTWFNGYDKKYFYDKGALFTCIDKRFRHILILQYLIRHKEIYDKIDFRNAYKNMITGSNDYLGEKNEIFN